MRAAVLLLLISSAHADNSIPSPPPNASSWLDRCGAALERANGELAKQVPEFAGIKVRLFPHAVHFDAWIHDREHGRFFPGKPAHFFVHVKEHKSKESGEIGATVGKITGSQASGGFSRWSKSHLAQLEVEIAEGRKVFLFQKYFTSAVDECLR